MDPGIAGCQVTDYVPGVVAAGVVYQDKLTVVVVQAQPRPRRLDSCNEGRQDQRTVISRYNDRNTRIAGRHGKAPGRDKANARRNGTGTPDLFQDSTRPLPREDRFRDSTLRQGCYR